ncbi:MAG: hypothetical protein EOP06_28180, partial [Proteobacteria bacterium]
MKHIFLTLLIFLASCAPKPTVVSTETPVMGKKESARAKFAPGTIVLDARPAFEFNMSHMQGAVNVAWEDFSRRPPDFRGLLDTDLHSITRRLALIGIDPNTNVLVVGKGKLGKGEEGRIAWTLQMLGVPNVQLAFHETFRSKKGEDPQAANRNFWDAQVNPALEIPWRELRTKIEGGPAPRSRARGKSMGAAALPTKAENFVVIDVRPKEEHSLDNLTKRTSRPLRFYNLDWRDFFTDDMDPNPALIKTLNELGIT